MLPAGVAGTLWDKKRALCIKIDDDNMRITITLEDPIFLKRPFVYAHIHKRRPPQQVNTWFECDAESSRGQVEAAYPGVKYKD